MQRPGPHRMMAFRQMITVGTASTGSRIHKGRRRVTSPPSARCEKNQMKSESSRERGVGE
jgi:hypothetical protein